MPGRHSVLPRCRFRVTARMGLAAISLALASVGGAVTVVAPDITVARTGGYTALPFTVEGEGSYAYEAEAPDGWTVVTPKSSVAVSESTIVFVTVVAPRYAAAGSVNEVALRLYDDGQEVAAATARLEVALHAEVALQTVPELDGKLDAPLTFHVTVGNLGNAADAVSIAPVNAMWPVTIWPSRIVLEPGARRTVDVTVSPAGTVSNGYRDVFYLQATSGNDPAAGARISVSSRWHDGSTALRTSSSPRLLFAVSTGLQVGATVTAGAWTPSVGYEVSPALEGELSDYVTAQATTDRFAGTLQDPFEELPSGVSLDVRGAAWDASVNAYAGRYAVQTTFGVGDWDLNVGGRFVPSDQGSLYGIRVGGTSTAPNLDLRLAAGSTQRGDQRTDSVTGRYSVPLFEGVDLGVGADVVGFSGSDRPYGVVAGLTQSLGWQNDTFEVQESYSGVPQSGLHTVGLSGGWIRPYPYGARASTSYTFSSLGDAWTNFATVYAYPTPQLSFDLRGSLVRRDEGLTQHTDWTVSPHAIWGFSVAPGTGGSVGLGYTHGDVLEGVGPSWNRYTAGFNVGFAGAHLQASSSYQEATAYADQPPLWDFKAAVSAGYGFGFGTDLSVGYGYSQRRTDQLVVEDDIRAAWRQSYRSGLQSLLAYDRTLSPTEGTSDENLSLGLSINDFLGQGFRLTGTYSIESPTSILDFQTPATHRFSLGVAHTFEFGFDTPDALIQAFGGRRGAEFSGTAYLDANRNGKRDPDEKGIAGVTVVAGPARTVTGDDGTFRVRVPEGTYQLAFPAGVPATLELVGQQELTFTDNKDVARDLAFAPVASLPVTVFYDGNRNGVRDEGEDGIAYGGVLFEGVQDRTVQMSGDGQLLVTGLTPGTYTVRPSPQLLPRGFAPTTSPVRVTLKAGEKGAAIALGAAPPERRMVQTFSSSDLAVLPQVRPTNVPRGAEVQILAHTQGRPDRVYATWDGENVPLMLVDGTWRTTIRVDPSSALGSREVVVRAVAGTESVERIASLRVSDAPPFEAPRVRAVVGQIAIVQVETLFKATEARLILPGGLDLPLRSDDGYHWTAQWMPAAPGSFDGRILVDGIEVGTVPLVADPEGDNMRATSEGGG